MCINICGNCRRQVGRICETAGKPAAAGSFAPFCDGVVCLFEYRGIVRDALKRYKFHDKQSYFRTFARLMKPEIMLLSQTENIDMIMSIPLHPKRQAYRGYNQAFLISKALSRETGLPEKSKMLVRCRETDIQSTLSRKNRAENIKNAFMVRKVQYIKDKTIVVVDDILTTGSTINECCRVLKEAGAKKVFAAVIATGRSDITRQ